MGVYTHLELRLGEEREKSLTRKGGGVAILWLACFRPSDVIQKGEDGFNINSKIRCDIQTAREQFEAGLTLLRKTFPATDFDIGEKEQPSPDRRGLPGLTAFREFLATPDAVKAELVFFEPCIYEAEFPGYLLQILTGFWQPDIKIYHPSPNRYEPWRRFDPGVMTWGGAIRALTLGGHTVEYHSPGSPIPPSPSLFTEEEYQESYGLLAGFH